MKLNLDSLRSEIEHYVESHGMIVFHSHPRAGDPSALVYWDSERYADYRQFLAAAEAAGVKLVTLYAREFNEDILEDALDQAASSHLPRDERRAIEMRMRELRRYLGFTCQIELSFDCAPRPPLLRCAFHIHRATGAEHETRLSRQEAPTLFSR